jgi:hypothetical protein
MKICTKDPDDFTPRCFLAARRFREASQVSERSEREYKNLFKAGGEWCYLPLQTSGGRINGRERFQEGVLDLAAS